MGVLMDVQEYLQFLTTTKLSVHELNSFIRNTEAGMQHENWQVQVIGNRTKVRKIRLILDEYPNENGGNGHNGNV